MRALLFIVALFAALVAPVAPARADADVHGLPLPPRTRSLSPDLFESGQGFRQTVDFYEHFLKRQGIAHEAVPIYRHRGTVVARFLARDRASRWQAIHVFQSEARTRIFIVPAPAPAAPGPPAARPPT